ncbi:hypothetical protein Syun_010339 [Stephania yunnanensis]|uniref:Uncharacterized protein n=1 Tax=Stephania yunnanensis TaxID=152371 RepID=A0AAP0KHA1_9MAGN
MWGRDEGDGRLGLGAGRGPNEGSRRTYTKVPQHPSNGNPPTLFLILHGKVFLCIEFLHSLF